MNSPHSDELPLDTETGPIRVLLCEDEIAYQAVMRRLCQALNLSLDMAASGAIGVDKVVNNQYDLILMDMNMPVMGGLEATETLRTLGYTSLPIVALTSNISDYDRQSCVDAGMSGFLTKPVNLNDLRATVEKLVLDKSRA